MKVYIKGNYLDKDGVGHHGEVVDVSEWKGNELIADNQAITEEKWKQQQEAAKRAAAEREAFEAERAGVDGKSSTRPSRKPAGTNDRSSKPAPEAPTHV